MRTFYARLRSVLVSDNRTVNPLKYALGEFILIVLGILAAIQIDNWNEQAKRKAGGAALSENLVAELARVSAYTNEDYKAEVRQHLGFLEAILKEGPDLDADSLFLAAENLYPVRLLTFQTYIFDFHSFYDPTYSVYKTASQDGSLFLLEDKKFIAALEFIYVSGPARIERLYEKEKLVNMALMEHIASKYAHLFDTPEKFPDPESSNAYVRELLQEASGDGTVRYLLFRKVNILRSKIFIIETQINPLVERLNGEFVTPS